MRSLNPFALVIQRRMVTLYFRVNDEHWNTSDVENLLRDMREIFHEGWQLDRCVRILAKTPDERDQLEVYVYRTVTAWKAFLQPYELDKEN